MKNIVCFSGGKDSTALIIYMIQKKIPIDEILYVDMGEWEWEHQKEHIFQFSKYLKKYDLYITSLTAKHYLEDGFKKYGFPHFMNRWCTGIKRELMKKYIKENYHDEEITQFIGFTSDEKKRKTKLYTAYSTKTPLYDAGITSKQALNICYKEGFNFNGFYKNHSHLNCFICPLQRINELRDIYINYPDKFQYLNKLQYITDGYYWNKKTVYELEQRFHEEQKENLKQKRENHKHEI